MDAAYIVASLALLAAVVGASVILESKRRVRKATEAAERKRRRDLRIAQQGAPPSASPSRSRRVRRKKQVN